MLCPRCRLKLKGISQEVGFSYSCPMCEGRAVALPVIRKLAPPHVIKDLWQRVISPDARSEIRCPSCSQEMAHIGLLLEGGDEYLDVCPQCHFIWFDHLEFERLPPNSAAPPKKELSPEHRKIIALAKVEQMQRGREWERLAEGSPDHWWEYILGLLRLPVEYNNAPVRNVPLITYGIAAAMVLATMLSLVDPGAVIRDWGLVPNQPLRNYGLTFVSSFLLHGGPMHLLGNLYFLLVFGDNVEDAVGKRLYLALVVLAALAGDLVHLLVFPHSATPLMGASGGISGILVYYCLRFPGASVGTLVWFRWLRIPVGLMLFFWIIWQFTGVYKQLSGFSNVSSLAHLGGALMGGVFWWLTRSSGDRQVMPVSQTG